MKKIFTLLVFASVCAANLVAQNQANNWYFGQNAGLSFNNDTVVVIPSPLVSNSGSASISGANGNILFYTDGSTVYNRLDDTMPHGINIGGNNNSTQSAIIIPNPGNSNLYYIFTTDAQAGPNGLRYTTVDMTLGNALGDVQQSNTQLADTIDEKVAATASRDGGYWVVAHQWPGDAFYAYKVSFTGVDVVPVVSHVGLVHNANNINNTFGQMKFSPDGKKLALAIDYQDTAQLFDFDAITGLVSHPITIPSEKSYGIEFSRTTSVLYITHYNSFFDTYDLDQYNLLAGTDTGVVNSKTTITTDSYQIREEQLGPDGKIYISEAFMPYLGVIANPDTLGLNCNFQDFAINLDPNFSGLVNAQLGLPNFISTYFLNKPLAAFSSGNQVFCTGNCISFSDLSFNRPSSWEWHFTGADSAISTQQYPQNICYNTPGSYPVTLIVSDSTGSDTLTLNNFITVDSLPSITSIAVIADTAIAISSGATQYQWYNNGESITGATSDTIILTPVGTTYILSVIVTNNSGCTDTAQITITAPLFVHDIGSQPTVGIYPNPSASGWNILVDNSLIGKEYKIYDTEGRTVYQSEIRNLQSEISIPVAAGVYLLQIPTTSGTITRKLIRM